MTPTHRPHAGFRPTLRWISLAAIAFTLAVALAPSSSASPLTDLPSRHSPPSPNEHNSHDTKLWTRSGPRRLQKRQVHLPAPPGPTQDKPDPPPSQRPKPTSDDPPPATSGRPQPTEHPEPPKPSHPPPRPPPAKDTSHADPHPSSAKDGSASGATPTATDSAALPSGTPSDKGEGVPTKVSEKVFIGLGTVGGLLVFLLGGVAFCRHRKKKNLAKALLQQTAQFSNNNPYAKISEPSAMAMTSTKQENTNMNEAPLGTYEVASTYTPALADEIEINMGDSVTVLQEYDDGWCMGVNNTRGGVKGVFPMHCLEMGQHEGLQPPSFGGFQAAANKRMSSMPGGWGHGGGGGFDPNYPPQSYPPYNQPYNQGGYDQSYGGGGGGGYYNGNQGY